MRIFKVKEGKRVTEWKGFCPYRPGNKDDKVVDYIAVAMVEGSPEIWEIGQDGYEDDLPAAKDGLEELKRYYTEQDQKPEIMIFKAQGDFDPQLDFGTEEATEPETQES